MQSVKVARGYDFISNNQMAIKLIKKEKPITTIICKLAIVRALPDTESAFSLSLVIVFSPFITLYLLEYFEAIFILNS